MAEEEALQLKSKDPELQKWLLAVLAKQQLENQRHIHQAHKEMRQFIEVKFNGITKVSGSNEAHGQPPIPNRFGGPGKDMLPGSSMPKQPSADSNNVAPSCQAENANTPAEENNQKPDTQETASTKIQVVDPNPTPRPHRPVRDIAAKMGIGVHSSRLATTASCLFEADGQLITKLMREPLDIVVSLMILASTISLFLQLQWKGYEARVALELEMPGGWRNAHKIFSSMEYFFSAIFLAELVLRVCFFKMRFFRDRLNLLDACVVVTTSVDTFVLSQLGGMEGDFMFMRLVRYTRLVRTLRFIRVMKLCHPLRVLIRTIASSFASLFWSMVIVAAYMLMSSLFVCQTVQEYMRDDGNPIDDRKWVEENYGSASKALWSMFEITFSGGWPTWVTPLVEKVSLFYAFYFAVYVGGVVFAVIRIITALFLKDTLAVAANDEEMMLQRKAAERAQFATKLNELYRTADTTGDGMIDWSEFRVLLEYPEAKALFSSIEFDTHEMESLFKLLDDGDGQVSFEEFLSGILRMKGTARSQDVLALMHDNRKILRQLDMLGLRVDGSCAPGDGGRRPPAEMGDLGVLSTTV